MYGYLQYYHLSLTLFFICNIFQKITKSKNGFIMYYPFSFIILGISCLFQNISQVKYIENYVFNYLVIILSFIISPIILFFGYLKKKRKPKHEY